MAIEKLLKNYRPNIGVVLFNRDGRVWYGHRVANNGERNSIDSPYSWQFPQGGIDEGETASEAAFRELKEETGVVSARLLVLTPGWVTYKFPPEAKRKGRKGQRQKWAAMVFEGADNEIDLTADDHQEFDDWRWGDLEEAPDLIVPFKRAVYGEMVTAFTPLRNFLRSP